MEISNQILYEMANVSSEESGLPVNIQIDEQGKYRKNKHTFPRLKIQNDYGSRPNSSNLIPVSIESSPKVPAGKLDIKNKDFKIIQKFIKINLDLLLQHWEGIIGTQKLMINLKTPENSKLF